MSYADPALAEQDFGWKAEYGIPEICASAWRWASRNPQGYSGPERTGAED